MGEPTSDIPPLQILIGRTAVGKSELAVELAERTGAEILSLDSMLVYRGLDVGTAKPRASLQGRVPHHLIDLVDPPERFDARRWIAAAEGASGELSRRGVPALWTGGTGFYLQALIHGLFAGPPGDPALRAELEGRYDAEGGEVLHAELLGVDPKSAERLHPNDKKRVVRGLEVWRQTGRSLSDWQREWGWHGTSGRVRAARILGLRRPEEELERRIRERTRSMLEAGWIEEARAIRDGIGFGPTSIQALGYREVLSHLEGQLSRAELEETIARRTRRFSKRQNTWFKRFEVEWFDAGAPDVVDRLEASLESGRSVRP